MLFLALACQRALTPVPALMPQLTVTLEPTSARRRTLAASLARQLSGDGILLSLEQHQIHLQPKSRSLGRRNRCAPRFWPGAGR